MSVADRTQPLLEVLTEYFSPPLARALLTSTLRRAKLDAVAMTPVGAQQAVHALEATLPLYMSDATRRAECLARLRARAPGVQSAWLAAAEAVSAARVAPTPSQASTVIHVKTAEDVSNASEVGRDIARRVGFPPVAQTKIATAIAELARNILLYAKSGDVHLAAVAAPKPGVEVIATDHGPGIADIDLVMNGAYRSKTGMGMGLRGAKRLMDQFEIASSPQGTRVVARKFLS